MRTPPQARMDARNRNDWAAAVGNERMTALAGAVLLVLIVVELVTAAKLRALLSAHVFAGVLLAGPLVVKMGSTGYRFVRYYTRSPAFVRKGPPRLLLRVLAPLLLATTLVVIGSGIGLVLTSPAEGSPLFRVHAVSSLIWLPMIAVHVFAYILQVPRNLADDWSKRPAERAPGRGLRLGVNLGALIAAAIAAILVLPVAAPWFAWRATNGNSGPAVPLIVGLLVAALALLATKPLRL